MKNIDISCIQGPMGRAFLVKRMPADRPNMGLSNVVDHFEFKIPNNCGSVQCKKLLWSKICKVDVSWLAHGHRPIFFCCFLSIFGLSSNSQNQYLVKQLEKSFFGPHPIRPLLANFFRDICFCLNGCKKNVRPIGYKAAELLDS